VTLNQVWASIVYVLSQSPLRRPEGRESDRSFSQEPAVAMNLPPGALGKSAPNSFFDAVEQGVLQAFPPDGALGTNALGDLYANPIAWKERVRGQIQITALALRHPGGVQHIGSFLLGLPTSHESGTSRCRAALHPLGHVIGGMKLVRF
jgi:hypothetical protein